MLPFYTFGRVIPYPCFNIRTLGNILTNYNLSWKYYAQPQDQPGYQFSIYNAISSIRNTAQWNLHIANQANFEADVAAGKLPAVTWIAPDPDDSEHAPHSSCQGENWTVSKINAITPRAPLVLSPRACPPPPANINYDEEDPVD